MLAAAVAVHGPSIGHGFVALDDDLYVTANPAVRAGLTWEGVQQAFSVDGTTYSHSVTWLSQMLDGEVFGLEPWGFHLQNVLWHAASAVLLLWLLLLGTGRVGPRSRRRSSFAVHPLGAEAVSWVTERTLSTALGLAAALVHVAGRGAATRARLAAVAMLVALAVLAKPPAIVFPILLLVLDFWPLRRLGAGEGAPTLAGAAMVLREKAVPFAVAAIVVVVAVVASAGIPRSADPPALGLRLANALVSIPRYLADAVWPSALGPFHPFPDAVPPSRAFLGLALVAAVTAAAVAARRRAPAIFAGWAWFLVALAPYLGFFQAGLWPARADRFVYLPLAALCVAAAFGLDQFLSAPGARRAALAAGAAAVVALGVAGGVQVGHWRISESLLRHGIEADPQAGPLHYALAAVIVRTGRFDAARAHAEEAVRLEPHRSAAAAAGEHTPAPGRSCRRGGPPPRRDVCRPVESRAAGDSGRPPAPDRPRGGRIGGLGWRRPRPLTEKRSGGR